MKVFILTLITIDHSDFEQFESYITKVIIGIYSSYESAVIKKEELHDILIELKK